MRRTDQSSIPAFLVFALCFGVALGASPARAQLPADLVLEELASGLSSPVAVRSAGDGSGRLFIGERGGAIRIWDGTQILATPFLDISAIVLSGGEQGLLGLAFHPNYGANGLFYVNYTDNAGDTVVEEYQVTGDPNVADPVPTEARFLVVDQPDNNHNGGDIHFGPDGFLYIGMGDGGGAGDASCFAQRLDVQGGRRELLGKMLRVEVDPFGVPGDNPFGNEIWSIGLRNPWRWSFDRDTGDMLIADVGQSTREEVSFQPAASTGGENYGWKVMEGTFCFDPDPIDPDCPAATPSCGDAAYTDPIMEVAHGAGDCAIIGGFRYRGAQIVGMQGLYWFSDSCSDRLWYGEESVGWSFTEWDDQGACNNCSPSSFGEGDDGELHMVALSGQLFRFSSATVFTDGFESGDTSRWAVVVP